jgi:type IV fimbrial biogenesis protein FimT
MLIKQMQIAFKNNQSGFTLIELIMTLVVGGIVMTMAVPSFSTFIKNNQLTTQANDMVSTINLSRTEAIKRRDRITICKRFRR